MKKVVLTLFVLFSVSRSVAQESQSDYNFLRLPVSAHVASLGGDNITLIEDDPSLIFHNPALISSVSDKMVGLNAMTYMQGVWTGSASYIRAIKERGTWGVSGQYMNYGSIRQFDENNIESGTFSAKDIALGGSFAYALNNYFVGGITAKVIYSNIGSYSSMAIGVDLGINYYNEDRGLSISAVARNLGGQVKAYNDDYEAIPFDLQLGVSKQLGNSPLCLHATLSNLHHWNERFINHLTLGADVHLSEQITISAGYSPRRADQMKIKTDDEDKGSSHGAGLSLGAGLQLERFQFYLGYAKYHVSSNSLLLNIAFIL